MKTVLLIIFAAITLVSCSGNRSKSSDNEAGEGRGEPAAQQSPEIQRTQERISAAEMPDSITGVYVTDEGSVIRYNTADEEGLILIEDHNHLFTILEKTPCHKWLIAEKAPFSPGEGRIETEYVLFYVPGAKMIDIELLNPALSSRGMHFAAAFGEPHLISYLKGSFIPVPLSFGNILEGRLPEIPEPNVYSSPLTSTGNESVILELKLGSGKGEIGQGNVIKQTEGVRTIYAVPSFAVYDNHLFIIDAINFRVLVYDMSASLVRTINYPREKAGGGTVIMEDMAVDSEFIYLFSSSGLFITDRTKEGEVMHVAESADLPLNKSEMVETGSRLHFFDKENQSTYIYDREKVSLVKADAEVHRRVRDHYAEMHSFTASAYGDHRQLSPGRHFIVKRGDGTIAGIFDSGHSACQASFLAADNSNHLYIATDEVEHPGGQFPGERRIRVISPEGEQIYSLQVRSWPGGPMNRNLIITKSGKIFEAFYDAETGFEEEPPSKLTVKRVK